ncbi:hypothetical protein ACJX0J_017153, partial [Zea mays]
MAITSHVYRNQHFYIYIFLSRPTSCVLLILNSKYLYHEPATATHLAGCLHFLVPGIHFPKMNLLVTVQRQMGHHHISRSYFRQTDVKRSGNASIDIMSKFFKLMVVLQLMNDLNEVFKMPLSLVLRLIVCLRFFDLSIIPLRYWNKRIIASLRANQFCERLPSPNGESTVDCHQISKMPNLAFTIANKTFTLTPEQYIVKLEQAGQTICINGFMAFDVKHEEVIGLGLGVVGAEHPGAVRGEGSQQPPGVRVPGAPGRHQRLQPPAQGRRGGFGSVYKGVVRLPGGPAGGTVVAIKNSIPMVIRSSRLSHSGISHLPADEVKPLVKYDNDEDAHSPGGRGRGRGGRGRGRGRGRGGRGNGFNEYADAGWEDDHAPAYMGNGYARGRGRSFRGRGRRGDDDNQPEYQHVGGFKGMRVMRVKNLNLYAFGLYMQPTSIREKLGPKYASFPTDKLMENPDFYRNGFNEYDDAGWEDDHSPAYMGNGYARGRGRSFRGRGRRGGDNNQPEYQQVGGYYECSCSSFRFSPFVMELKPASHRSGNLFLVVNIYMVYPVVLCTSNFVHIEPVRMTSSLKVIEMLQSSNGIQHIPCAAISALISRAGNANWNRKGLLLIQSNWAPMVKAYGHSRLKNSEYLEARQ